MSSTSNLFIGLVVISLIAIKIYNLWIKTFCTCKTRMDGKTVIITGSNTDDIIRTTGNTKVEVRELDLSSLSSVRRFAKHIVETEPKLDILINNAGLGGVKRTLTEDNIEMTVQVNHFAPFLLTCLLLDLLKKSAPSRIVFVSSILHRAAIVDFDNLFGEKWYISLHQYSISKLANILITKELAKKLEGTGVTVNSLHPGTIVTDVWRNVHPILREPLIALLKIFCKDVVEGIQTTVHVAVAEELEGVTGKYFDECKEIQPSKSAMDEGLAKKFWEKSEILVGLKPEEKYF